MSSGGGELGVFLGKRDGTLNALTPVILQSVLGNRKLTALAIAIADMNGDGAQVGCDVVSFALGGSVSINGIVDTALDAAHPLQQLAGGTLAKSGATGGSYQLDWAGGEGLSVANGGFYLNLHATVPGSDASDPPPLVEMHIPGIFIRFPDREQAPPFQPERWLLSGSP